MSRWPPDELLHIRDELSYLVGQCQQLTAESFKSDETRQRAFVRALEVIGEASKRLPSELRQQYADINWRAISGMRDRLIHAYFGVDYDIVWDVAANQSERLLKRIEDILRNESPSEKRVDPMDQPPM